MKHMELSDKVIVTTGSTSGLGKALAQQLVHEGAKVVINGRKREEVDYVAQELGITGFVADVTKKDEIVALASYVVDKFGRIDLWVNNAGIWFPHATLAGQDSERVHAMMNVNFFGTLYGCQAAFAQMQKQKSGMIVNILSTSALKFRPNSIGYGASKSAAMSLTKSLQQDTELNGIRVIGVYPGGMQTRFFDEKRPDDYGKYMVPAQVAERIVAHIKKEDPDPELMITRDV